VGVYDLEVAPIKSLKQIASKLAGTNFLLPDNSYDDRLLASTLDRFKGKLFLYDRTGSRDWQDIKTCMIEQHYQLGVCEFFLDPLTALISRFNSSEANDKLNEIMTDIADLVSTYPITIICFSHVNPPNKGSKSHEEGGKVLSGQMTGSRAIEKWSHIGLGLERNRSAECPPEEVNHSQVKILYDREHGTSGTVDMFYNQDTTEYLETIKRKW
jgi:twinkle protein